MKLFLAPMAFAMLIGCASAPPVATYDDQRPRLLQLLDGNWTMTGDVMGQPVVYNMVAGPTLANAFTELYMKDAAAVPEYEARVFIGYDHESGAIITHWMDSFGAAYSIPHGTGTMTDRMIRFIVPYDERPFRDTLIYDSANRSWQLVIEARNDDGTWKHFARYAIASAEKERQQESAGGKKR